MGIDYDGDGIADNVDADGNGVLDNAIGIDCNFPYPYEFWLIAENAGENPTYTGVDMPQGMGVAPDGKIGYDAPCSDSGQTFIPGFYVSGQTELTEIVFTVD